MPVTIVTPEEANLSVIQGNDVTFPISLTYNGTPFNPTNYTLSLILKASPTTSDGSGITFTTSNGLTVVNAVTGQITWKLPHADTGTPGTNWWRLNATDVSGNVITLIMGNLTILAA